MESTKLNSPYMPKPPPRHEYIARPQKHKNNHCGSHCGLQPQPLAKSEGILPTPRHAVSLPQVLVGPLALPVSSAG